MEKFVEAVRKGSKQAIREKSVTGEWVFRLVKLVEGRCPGSECVTRSMPLSVELE